LYTQLGTFIEVPYSCALTMVSSVIYFIGLIWWLLVIQHLYFCVLE